MKNKIKLLVIVLSVSLYFVGCENKRKVQEDNFDDRNIISKQEKNDTENELPIISLDEISENEKNADLSIKDEIEVDVESHEVEEKNTDSKLDNLSYYGEIDDSKKELLTNDENKIESLDNDVKITSDGVIILPSVKLN